MFLKDFSEENKKIILTIWKETSKEAFPEQPFLHFWKNLYTIWDEEKWSKLSNNIKRSIVEKVIYDAIHNSKEFHWDLRIVSHNAKKELGRLPEEGYLAVHRVYYEDAVPIYFSLQPEEISTRNTRENTKKDIHEEQKYLLKKLEQISLALLLPILIENRDFKSRKNIKK